MGFAGNEGAEPSLFDSVCVVGVCVVGVCVVGVCVVGVCVVGVSVVCKAFDADGRDASRGDGNGLLQGDAGPAPTSRPTSRSNWPSDTPAVEPMNDATNTARIAAFLGRITPVVLEHALRCNRIDNSDYGDAGWRNSTPEGAPIQMEQSELPSHAIQSSCPLVIGERSIRTYNANLEKSQRILTSELRDQKIPSPTISVACSVACLDRNLLARITPPSDQYPCQTFQTPRNRALDLMLALGNPILHATRQIPGHRLRFGWQKLQSSSI